MKDSYTMLIGVGFSWDKSDSFTKKDYISLSEMAPFKSYLQTLILWKFE